MNLHQITSQGEGQALGPVEITRTFQKFAGSQNVLVLVRDSSMSDPVGIKIWGAASNTQFQVGQLITLEAQGPKGKLEYKEYKGKWEINANDCRVNIQGGGQESGHSHSQSRPSGGGGGYQPRGSAQASHGSSGGNENPQELPFEEVERRMTSYVRYQALFTRLLIDELVLNHGFEKEEALQLASGGAAGLYAQSWFCQKGH